MAIVVVYTDKGQQVSSFEIDVSGHIGNATWRNLVGRWDAPLGWLGRTLQDAAAIERGVDPERPSEKALRLVEERKKWPGEEGYMEDNPPKEER